MDSSTDYRFLNYNKIDPYNQPLSSIAGHKCVVPNCDRSYRHTKFVRLFVFPQKESVRKIWLKNCGLNEDLKIKKFMRVCDIHFEHKYIGKKFLLKAAVPTLNLPSNSNLNNSENCGKFGSVTVRSLSELMSSDCVENSENNIENGKSLITLKDTDTKGLCTALNTNTVQNNKQQSNSLKKKNLKYKRKLKSITDCQSCKTLVKKYNSAYSKLLKNNQRITNLEKAIEKCLRLSKRDHEKTKERFEKSMRNIKLLQLRLKKEKEAIPRILCSRNDVKKFEIIKNFENISEGAALFFCMLLKTKNSWREKEKDLATDIHIRSRLTYKYMERVIHMHVPSVKSVDRWLRLSKRAAFKEEMARSITYSKSDEELLEDEYFNEIIEEMQSDEENYIEDVV